MLPIVLHHGFGGTSSLKLGPLRPHYFRGIDSALAGSGRDIIASQVHPTAGIAYRAQQLKQQILSGLDQRRQPEGPVIIIAHSMGGLDARYMIRKLDMESRVAALLTVTTPHRGCPVADWFVKHLDRRIPFMRFLESCGWDVEAARDLTAERCKRFNDETPDSDHVRYYSISAARPWHLVPAFAYPSHRLISDLEGENDGLVSVKSSIWGQSLGTWAADHWHTINRRFVLEFRNPTGDIAPYYERALGQVETML